MYIVTRHVFLCTGQKEQNESTKKESTALRDMVLRMEPVLRTITSAKGLDAAQLVLENLGISLITAQRIYSKYHHGWTTSKFWVTPAQILEKTRRTKTQMHEAFQELTLALNVANHIKGEEKSPHTQFEESQKTWEIAFSDLNIDRCHNGTPKVVLGSGAFGIVGLATFKGDEVTFLCTF